MSWNNTFASRLCRAGLSWGDIYLYMHTHTHTHTHTNTHTHTHTQVFLNHSSCCCICGWVCKVKTFSVGVLSFHQMYGLLYYKCQSELWLLTGIEESITCVVCSSGQSTHAVYIFLCSKCQNVPPDLLVVLQIQ